MYIYIYYVYIDLWKKDLKMCLFRKEMLKCACEKMSKLDFKGHTVTAMKATELSVAFCQGSWCGSWVMLITRWRGNLRSLARSCNVGVFLMQLRENGWKLSTCHVWRIDGIRVLSGFLISQTMHDACKDWVRHESHLSNVGSRVGHLPVWRCGVDLVCHQLSRAASDDEIMLVWCPVIGWCIHVYSFRIQTAIAWVAQSLKDLWPKAFQNCQPGNLQNHPFFQLTSTIFPPLRVMLGGFVSMCDRVLLVDRFYLMRQLQNPSNPSFFDPNRVCKIKVDMATILITLAMRNCMHVVLTIDYFIARTIVYICRCF